MADGIVDVDRTGAGSRIVDEELRQGFGHPKAMAQWLQRSTRMIIGSLEIDGVAVIVHRFRLAARP